MGSQPKTSTAPFSTTDEELQLPRRMRLVRRHGGLDVQVRWLRIPIVLAALFFGVIAYGGVFLGLLVGTRSVPFWLGIGGAAAFLSYTWLSYLLNTTTLSVGSGLLSVRVRPFPWPGWSKDLLAKDIEQLFLRRAPRFRDDRRANGPDHYLVYASLKSGKKVVLPLHHLEEEQARQIERLIEDHLELENKLGVVHLTS